ncbi:MAG: DEAD/DEAH box helicase, partial [Phycicoccus sp.]
MAAGRDSSVLRHVERLPPREARHGRWPGDLDPGLVAALAAAGLGRPWSHQRDAVDLARAGAHVVLATGTASGKSLGYLVPVLDAVLAGARSRGPTTWRVGSASARGATDSGPGVASGDGATALYLAPTKALAADQLARIDALAVPGVRVATYDGDTPPDERRWVRDHAHVVLTNPDLLHHSLLPGHRRWSRFLRALRYVVVDECHVYRGVFGAHIAAVLRHVERLPPREARHGRWPGDLDPRLVAALAAAGLGRPWSHQRDAVDLARAGAHVVLATGTASGKSLGY